MNVAKGIKGLAKSIFNVGIASEDTICHRRSLCQSCEHQNIDNLINMPTCRLCGCLLWHKTRLADEQCPKNPPLWTESKAAEFEEIKLTDKQ